MKPTDVSLIYRQHSSFVDRVLGRYGVPETDRPDQVHEVFVVVLRRWPSYRGEGAMTTWLFSICRFVAASYRRRAHRVREVVTAEIERAATAFEDDRHDRVDLHKARTLLLAIIDKMSAEQGRTFIMMEMHGQTGRQVASHFSCPLQTVFSRRRQARRIFDHEVQRLRALHTSFGT